MGSMSKTIAKKGKMRKKELQDRKVAVNIINSTKMVSMLVLRNEGWGETRLIRFSESFDKIMGDVSKGYITVSDIAQTLKDETGINPAGIML